MIEDQKQESKESVKLIKNSKGYNWEIKIHLTDFTDQHALERLKKLNEDLTKEYALNA